MALRKIPIRRAGNRHNLFMGGDRELVMFAGALAASLIFTAQTWLATGYGLVMWFTALWSLREMAKKDPLMRKVYIRHLRYSQDVYPARSTPFHKNTRLQRKLYR
ncbi:conjugal transfer protein TrbD [Azohydromonas lata]|uniref:Conjugal transfer protein TrbD n=1 Tax=Azohydromonas lata TaxID=45677 RepID=A0ABU5IK78_9BURK|nr:conjugal transfer protein TrbD [Azohydromonas lata]MDZ5459291.1 conjugal transfer protein TrbD [Azohydromonas lata]